MDRLKYYTTITTLILIILMILCGGAVLAENIDPGNTGLHHAWGENVGWLNFKPSQGPGVTVTSSNLTGYIWGENIGWINLSPEGGGVVNDGSGKLSGYAWGENVGWINFAPSGGGVAINACGEFNGYAWGENIGWISFRSDGPNPFKLITAWQSPLDNVPPATTYVPALLPWYKTDAAFNFSATDCGQGPREVRYRINSGSEISTPGATALATVTTEACNMLEYYAIDLANNIEPSRILTVCIDKTPPVVTISIPANGATYYINQGSPSSFAATDILSGIASIASTVPLGSVFNTAAAGSYTFNVTATDNAGNTTSVTHSYSVIYPGNMDPDNAGCRYAWAENVGWVNFKPARGPGVTVSGEGVSGMAWGENIGWIKFNPVSGGVMNDGKGRLSGYAWAENAGWINFRPANGGVSIGNDGTFTGYAWGENIGWINFSAANSCVKTAWTAPADITPPVISGTPADIMSEAASSAGAVVTYGLPTANDAMDGPVPVSCSPASGSVYALGTTTVTCIAVDSHGNIAKSTFRVIVLYNWTGFFRPIDNPPVVNKVKAGSAVAIKFSLAGNQGLSIMAPGSPASGMIPCDSTALLDDLTETATAGSSSLTYDAAEDRYSYIWKTKKAWAGTCRQLRVRLKDDSVHTATFKFAK